MRRATRCAFLLIAIAASTGCSSLLTSDVPPETVYWLEPPGVLRSAPASGAPSITVRITAAPGLDTDRLLARGPGAVLSSYAGARWAGNIPDVLEVLIRTVLEDSGRFSRVASSSSGSRSEWILDLELRAFFATMTAELPPPTVEMSMSGYLACQGRQVAIRIASDASASENTLTSISGAFQAAAASAATELLDHILGHCQP